MSYAVHKTEAILVRLIGQGEANRDAVFLTREYGKISARVQSARAAHSTMRMHLTRYNHVMIDLVQGKQFWRLTGIHQAAPHHLFSDNGLLHAFHRAILLAEHLIRGEDPHPEVFDFFVNVLNYIDQVIASVRQGTHEKVPAHKQSDVPTITLPDANSDLAQGLELYAVIKVLDHLGYWPGEHLPEVPTDEILQKCLEQKTALVAMINEGINATQIV